VIEAVSSYLNSLGKEAVSLKAAIIANIKYIQNVYGPGGKYANRASSLSNREAIEHLINLCFSGKNTANRIIRTSHSESIINQLEGYLLSCYYTDW
ncbi:MAG: hypothetical protein K2H60_04790, partial [Muribaculaceae bacterium]|nr:hypothetical protein [Muribaculaceae bacterium]